MSVLEPKLTVPGLNLLIGANIKSARAPIWQNETTMCVQLRPRMTGFSAFGATENSPPFQRRVESHQPAESRGDDRLFLACRVRTPILRTAMHAFTSCYLHCVWSTKERRPLITPALQSRLWPYVGGIARANKMAAVEVGGVADHLHVLLSLPSTLSISKAIQLLKGNSSKWIHESFPEQETFEWQEGYGAFSIGVSGIEATVDYIRQQAEHHRKRTFKEEFVEFLKKHEMTYDDSMLE